MSGGAHNAPVARAHVSPRAVVTNGWGFSGYAGFVQRAGASTTRRHTGGYRIEGETLSVAEIAERLGVSARTVQRRMQAARPGGPVTWETLR